MPPAAVILILTCLCSIWYHSFVVFVSAEWVNLTIDDTFGDNVSGQQFVYSPDDKWTTGQNCTGCLAHPNASEAFDHSWHDSSFFPGVESSPPSASVSFNGTAVYVYCIIFHSDSSPDGYTNLNFAIDGEMVGEPFISIPSNSTSIDYNRLVYANNSLSWGPHTLTITNGANGSQTSLALLDYVQYTTEVQMTSPFPSTISKADPPLSTITSTATTTMWLNKPGGMDAQTRAIVIATTTVGGAVFFALCAFLVYFCRRYSYKTYGPPAEGLSSQPTQRTLCESERSSGWAEDTWTNNLVGQRFSHISIRNVRQTLLTFISGSGRKGERAKDDTPVSSGLYAVKVEDDAPIVLETVSVRHVVSPSHKIEGSLIDGSYRASRDALATPPVQAKSLSVTIPALPPLPEPITSTPPISSRLPPIPRPSPASQLPERPKSEAAPSHPPPTVKAIRRLTDMPAVKMSPTAHRMSAFGSDRMTILTSTSALTTPTSYVPSGFFISNPSTPYLPARSDSVKTVDPMPLVPNRRRSSGTESGSTPRENILPIPRRGRNPEGGTSRSRSRSTDGGHKLPS